NNRDIVIWAEGKIIMINTENIQVTEIPFTVENTIQIAETQHSEHTVFTENFRSLVIRDAVTSPDGKTLVFNSVGQLWRKNLPNGKPQRLTKDNNFEFEPAFSPNGKDIIYVTWTDDGMGAIKRVSLS